MRLWRHDNDEPLHSLRYPENTANNFDFFHVVNKGITLNSSTMGTILHSYSFQAETCLCMSFQLLGKVKETQDVPWNRQK